MSKRYDLEWSIASWCAKRELPQEEVVYLVQDILAIADQVDVDTDDEGKIAREAERVKFSVKDIYAKVLGYTPEQKG